MNWQIWSAAVGIANACLFFVMIAQLIWRLHGWDRPQRIWFAVVAVVCAWFAGHLYTETVSNVPFRPVAVAIGSVWVVISTVLSAALFSVDVRNVGRVAMHGEQSWTCTPKSRNVSPSSPRSGARPIPMER